ncbi:MAG: helix-turn-helix transcriptional regulator [Gemmatimonadota bacterium]
MPTPPIDARVTPAMLHILLALASEDMHGYGIMQAIEERTHGAVEIGPGTLYRTIAHLGKVGWIEEAPTRASDNRRTYRITTSGREAAGAEAQRLARLVSWAEQSDLLEGAG